MTTCCCASRSTCSRPVLGCSKYCLGMGFTRPELKDNRFRPLLRRYFEDAVSEPRAVAA